MPAAITNNGQNLFMVVACCLTLFFDRKVRCDFFHSFLPYLTLSILSTTFNDWPNQKYGTGKTPRFAENLFRGRDFRADGALELRARGVVIVQRLHLRAARLREGIFRVQHVELRAGAGVGAGVGFAQ